MPAGGRRRMERDSFLNGRNDMDCEICGFNQYGKNYGNAPFNYDCFGEEGVYCHPQKPEPAHEDFLVGLGYKHLGGSPRKYVRLAVFIGFDKSFRRLIILRRNKKRTEALIAGNVNELQEKKKAIYDVVYKGYNVFDDLVFAAKLFSKLRIDMTPSERQAKRLQELQDVPLSDEAEDMDVYLDEF